MVGESYICKIIDFGMVCDVDLEEIYVFRSEVFFVYYLFIYLFFIGNGEKFVCFIFLFVSFIYFYLLLFLFL